MDRKLYPPNHISKQKVRNLLKPKTCLLAIFTVVLGSNTDISLKVLDK